MIASTVFCACLCFFVLVDATVINTEVNGSSDQAWRSALLWPPVEEPIVVHVGYYIESIGAIDQQSMTYEMDIYFAMSWRNRKAAHNDTGMIALKAIKGAATMWIPDIYFPNEKEASYHRILQPSGAVYLKPDGSVAWSVRITLKLTCNLNLRRYPLDKQDLYMTISSYTLPEDAMQVRWFTHKPIALRPDLELADFEVTGFDAQYCDYIFDYAISEDSREIGRFSCLKGVIHLKRYILYYLIKDFVPHTLIVVTSWASFWIDKTAVPARVTLSFTTLLTITTMGGSMYATLPRVSYSKAIDYWFGACLVFVIGALLEYAWVNDSLRRGKRYAEIAAGGAGRRRRNTLVERQRSASTSNGGEQKPASGCKSEIRQAEDVDGAGDPIAARFGQLSDTYQNRASLIDKVSRVVFPAVFAVFCAVFWLKLLL